MSHSHGIAERHAHAGLQIRHDQTAALRPRLLGADDLAVGRAVDLQLGRIQIGHALDPGDIRVGILRLAGLTLCRGKVFHHVDHKLRHPRHTGSLRDRRRDDQLRLIRIRQERRALHTGGGERADQRLFSLDLHLHLIAPAVALKQAEHDLPLGDVFVFQRLIGQDHMGLVQEFGVG